MFAGRIGSDWNVLSDEAQLRLARGAMHRAAATMAQHAELLAEEMECGAIADLGGADALRLLAKMVRLSGQDTLIPAGTA